jgi:hypothetical protein
LHKRPEGYKRIPPLIPRDPLQGRRELDHELPVPLKGSGEILNDISRTFFLILLQQPEKPVIIEKLRRDMGGNMR